MALFHVYAPQDGVSQIVDTDDGPEDAERQVRELVTFQSVVQVSEVPTPEAACDKHAKRLPRRVVEVVTAAPESVVLEEVVSIEDEPTPTPEIEAEVAVEVEVAVAQDDVPAEEVIKEELEEEK